MEVIPVIDLKGGAVVRARHGLRESYTPISTSLAQTSAPLDIVAGLLTLYPFDTIYVADLDRIESRAGQAKALDHDDFGLTQSKIMNVIDSKSLERDAGGKPVSTFPHPALEDLIAAFPSVTFWVDAGVRDAVEARSWLHRHENSHLVLGTESLTNSELLAELAGERRLILSLDYRGEEFLGPEEILDRPHLWPARVIVMTLTRVGSGAGPDMERLALIGSRAPNATLFAAGGLRGPSDLMRLEEAGVRGVLVASALHDGRLTGADLAAARQGASKEK